MRKKYRIYREKLRMMEENTNLDENGIWKDKNELRRLQIILTEMLVILDEVCKKNDIPYVMFGGTLLGAVRHKGFVPWDDDVDVAVPRAAFDRLEGLLIKALPEHLKVQTPNTDSGCISQIMRIRNTKVVFETPGSTFKGSEIQGAFIDIFPLDNACNEHSIKMSLQAYLAKKFLATMSDRSGGIEKSNAKHDSVKRKIADAAAMTIPRARWIEWRRKIMMWEQNSNAPYFINLCSHYNHRKQVFLKEKIFPAEEIIFENHKFCAPSDYDYVLKRFYGENYMRIPELKERHMEDHIILNLKVEG